MCNATLFLYKTDAPRIKNDPHCIMDGHFLTCTCVSHGWPIPVTQCQVGLNSKDYNITESVSIATSTVTSTITTTNFSLVNNTMECFSVNQIGKARIKFTLVEKSFTGEEAGRFLYSDFRRCTLHNKKELQRMLGIVLCLIILYACAVFFICTI